MNVADLLIQKAKSMGATDAAVIPAAGIVVEQELAMRCNATQCENFGTSAGCPPHVKGPGEFRRILRDFTTALVFMIAAPASLLRSQKRGELFIRLHETAAGLRQAATGLGCLRAAAFASGGCKRLFCGEYPDCPVLEGGECRYPDRACPSMSGYGVDVARLVESAGWPMTWLAGPDEQKEDSPVPVVGLVLFS